MRNLPLENEKKRSGLKIGLIILGTAVLASILTFWLAKAYLFPNQFKPTRLNDREVQVLDTKIKALTSSRGHASENPKSQPEKTADQAQPLAPERYSEKNAKREISLTERELNGLLARNTDLARKLAIDLSDDLASAKLLIPLDPELPVVGGKVLKVTAGLELRFTNSKPVVILRGVSIWGVPVPSSWMGGLKNIDLVSEFGIRQGFWQTFSAGVEYIRIEEGQLSIRLKP